MKSHITYHVDAAMNGARNSEDAQWAVDERTWLAALDLAYDRMAAEA